MQIRVYVVLDSMDQRIVEVLKEFPEVKIVQWDYSFDTACQWAEMHRNVGIDVVLASEYAQVSTLTNDGQQIPRDTALLTRTRDLHLYYPQAKFILLCDPHRGGLDGKKFLSSLVSIGIYDFKIEETLTPNMLKEYILSPKSDISKVQQYLPRGLEGNRIIEPFESKVTEIEEDPETAEEREKGRKSKKGILSVFSRKNKNKKEEKNNHKKKTKVIEEEDEEVSKKEGFFAKIKSKLSKNKAEDNYDKDDYEEEDDEDGFTEEHMAETARKFAESGGATLLEEAAYQNHSHLSEEPSEHKQVYSLGANCDHIPGVLCFDNWEQLVFACRMTFPDLVILSESVSEYMKKYEKLKQSFPGIQIKVLPDTASSFNNAEISATEIPETINSGEPYDEDVAEDKENENLVKENEEVKMADASDYVLPKDSEEVSGLDKNVESNNNNIQTKISLKVPSKMKEKPQEKETIEKDMNTEDVSKNAVLAKNTKTKGNEKLEAISEKETIDSGSFFEDVEATMNSKMESKMESVEAKIMESVDCKIKNLESKINSINAVPETRQKDVRLTTSDMVISQEPIEYTQDFLTGVGDREYLKNLLELNAMLWHKDTTPFSVIMIDLDDFKKINDKYGHQEGDKVLLDFASHLKSCIRIGDAVTRYGGEEFCVVLCGATKLETYKVAEKLKKTWSAAAKEKAVTFSAGIGEFGVDGFSINDLLQAADQAMYVAKKSGKNTIVLSGETQKDSAGVFQIANPGKTRTEVLMVAGAAAKTGATSFTLALATMLSRKCLVEVVDVNGGASEWIRSERFSVRQAPPYSVVPGRITIIDAGTELVEEFLPMTSALFVTTDLSRNAVDVQRFVGRTDNVLLVGMFGVSEKDLSDLANVFNMNFLASFDEDSSLREAEKNREAIVPKKWAKKLKKLVNLIQQ